MKSGNDSFARRAGKEMNEGGVKGGSDGYGYGCRDLHLPEEGKGVERGNLGHGGGNRARSGRERGASEVEGDANRWDPPTSERVRRRAMWERREHSNGPTWRLGPARKGARARVRRGVMGLGGRPREQDSGRESEGEMIVPQDRPREERRGLNLL